MLIGKRDKWQFVAISSRSALSLLVGAPFKKVRSLFEQLSTRMQEKRDLKAG
jgi:ATP-dependent Zn protease